MVAIPSKVVVHRIVHKNALATMILEGEPQASARRQGAERGTETPLLHPEMVGERRVFICTEVVSAEPLIRVLACLQREFMSKAEDGSG